MADQQKDAGRHQQNNQWEKEEVVRDKNPCGTVCSPDDYNIWSGQNNLPVEEYLLFLTQLFSGGGSLL